MPGRIASAVLIGLFVFMGILGAAQAQIPDINLTKTAGQAFFDAAGDVLTYTFTVKNTGGVTLTNVTVTDPLITVSGGPIASLAPGAEDTTTFTASYTVTQADVDAGYVDSYSTVHGTPPSGPEVTNPSNAFVFAAQNPSMTLLKTADQAGYVEVGAVLTYKFTVTNTGNVTLTNVVVSDPQATVSGGSIASLAPGASDNTTFTASYTIVQADVDAGFFSNTATVTAMCSCGTVQPANDTETVSAIPAVPSIAIIKTAQQADYDGAGDILTYTFTVENTGNVTLTNVIVADPVAAVTGGPIASLAPGAIDTTTFAASYTVTQPDLDLGSFTNTATATGTPPSGPDVTGTDSETVPAEQTPGIFIEKDTAKTSYSTVGEVINYTFRVSNTGNVTLTNVTVTDPQATVSGGPITLAPGELDSTTFTATYTVTQSDLDAGSFYNTATVTGTPPSGPPVASVCHKRVPALQSPSIMLEKAPVVFGYSTVGDVLTYTFTVTNTGNVTLTNITVTDPLATVAGGPIASLAPGAVDTATFTASYTVTQADLDAGIFTNTATAAGTPPTGPAVTDDDDATVEALQNPSIALDKNAVQASYSAAGDVLTYTFKVENTGNVTLTNVIVTDPAATVTGGPIVSLAPGAIDTTTFAANYAVTQTDVDAGSFTNTATATGTPPLGSDVTDTGSATVPVQANPALRLVKTAAQANFDAAGDVLTYTFTVENAGNVTLTNVMVTDPTATVMGGPIASLAAGAVDTTTFTASYTVSQGDVDAGSFANTATATGTPPSGPAVTDSDTATVPALQSPSIMLEKAPVVFGYSAVGDVLTYTFTVTNTGNVTLTNITVTDPLATVAGGPIASLAPGAVDTVTFTASYTATQADLDTGIFTNTATASGTPPTGPAVTDDDEATVEALQNPSIALDKSAVQTSYNAAGNVLTYTFKVENTGNVTLANVIVTDPAATVTGGPIVSLAPGAIDTTTFTANYAVTQTDVDAGSFTNTATATGTPPLGSDVTDTGSATVPAQPAAAIQIVKTAVQANYDAAGDVLTYTFAVTNTGNVTLTNITVTDPSATVTGGPIASLAPGAIDTTTFAASHTVTQADVDGGSFANTATAAGTPPSGPVVTDTDTATVPALVNASMTLDKTAMQDYYDAVGDVLTYTFVVVNTSNVTLTDVTLTDPAATVMGGPIPSLAPGATDTTTFTASYTVTQADLDAGHFTNTATVRGAYNLATSDGGGGSISSKAYVTATDSATVPPVSSPSISLVKSAVQANYDAAGDVLAYTFTVTNTGNVQLTNVTVTDPSATVTGGPLTLAPGASDSTTFTASHTITQADVNAGSYANTATATGTPPSGPDVTDSDTITVPGLGSPSISVVKTAVQANYDAAGDVLTYTFTVTNTGNVTLANITLTDPSATVTGGPIVSLAPGASDSTTFTASHTATQADVNAGSYANTATATGTPPSGPDVTDSDTITVPALANPSISIVKTAQQTSYGTVGAVLTYKFTVTNTGNVTLTNITVTDPSATVTGGPIAALAPGASDSSTFTASHTVTQADINAGSYANTATATGTPPSGPDVTDGDTVTVPALANPSISIVKTAMQTSYSTVGDVLTYTFTVTNTGNVTLTNVTVTDPSATVTGGPITLAPGASDSTSFAAAHAVTQADLDAGAFSNTATGTGTPPSGPPVTDSDTVTVTAVANPSISVVKTATQASYNSVGDVLTYTFTVTNTGNVTLTNVTVTDPSATVAGGPIASLAPGASDSSTFTASHTVTQADINAGSYANTGTTSGNPPSGPPVTDNDTVTVTGVQTATVSLVKEAIPATFSEAGDVITYRFTITNTGNVTLYNVTLTDTLIPVSGGPIAELAPGASDSTTFTGTYTVTEEDVANGSVVNVATVHANNLVGPPVTATDDAQATLDSGGCKSFNPIAIILGLLAALGTILGVCFSGC